MNQEKIELLREAIERLKNSLNALEKAKFVDNESIHHRWYNLGVEFAINLYKSDIESCEFQITLLS